MNRDGHLDLVVCDLVETTLLLGDGLGGFTIAARIPAPGLYLAVADLDGDGYPDIVVAGQVLKILYMRGVQLASAAEVQAGATTILLGDLDEDGHPDMATREGATIAVRLNHGDGTFGLPTVYDGVSLGAGGCARGGIPARGASGRSRMNATLPLPELGINGEGDTAMGDLDGDGHLDIVGIFQNGDSVVLHGNGDGTFRGAGVSMGDLLPKRPQPWRRRTGAHERAAPGSADFDPYAPTFIVLADLLGDHHARAVVLRGFPGAEVMGQRSVGEPTAAAVADFDGDGRQDIVVAGEQGVVALHPVGADGFPILRPQIAIDDPWGAELADINGDGIGDVITWGDGWREVDLRKPDGTFGDAFDAPGDPYSPHTFADVNGDGRLDWIDGSEYEGAPALFLGHGDGTYDRAPVTYFDRPLANLSPGDLDEDGKEDLAVISAGQVVLLHGNGDGTFRLFGQLDVGAYRVSVLDVDGDGHLDLVVTEADKMEVYFGRGDGTFVEPVHLEIQTRFAFITACVDVNGDGQSDLVAGDYPDAAEYLRTSRSFRRVDLGFGALDPVVADADGDGRPDVIAEDEGRGVAIHFGIGDGTFREPTEAYGPIGWRTFVLLDQPRPDRQDIITVSPYDYDGYDNSETVITNHITPNRVPATAGAHAAVAGPRVSDHGWAEVSIAGVSDPDGDAVNVQVTGITQDEPVGRGVGRAPPGGPSEPASHCPDAEIVDGKGRVRWERDGSGNGRVYAIHFTAADNCGGTSPGVVTVCVPHDASSTACVDDGQLYNSLACNGGRASGSPGGDTEQLLPPVVHAGGADLRYALAKATEVRLEIFDLLGRRRAVVASGWQPPGEYLVRWQPQGAAGVYFARLTLGRTSYIRSFALLK